MAKEAPSQRVCNICRLPGVVTYFEFDEDKGTKVAKRHKCHCLGHEGIHSSLWNRASGFSNSEGNAIKSLSYDDFQKFFARRRRKQHQEN